MIPGLLLTGLVTAILAAGFGAQAVLPGLAFGAVATTIQLAATALGNRAAAGTFEATVKAFGAGFGLRLLGIGLMLAAIVARRDLFPPLPTAFGFLGVTIPLLFMEMRKPR